jgi:hypothetical protein
MLVEDMSRNKFFPVSNITCFTLYINLWPIYWLYLVFSSKPEGSAEDLFSSLQLTWGVTMYLSILLHTMHTHARGRNTVFSAASHVTDWITTQSVLSCMFKDVSATHDHHQVYMINSVNCYIYFNVCIHCWATGAKNILVATNTRQQ